MDGFFHNEIFNDRIKKTVPTILDFLQRERSDLQQKVTFRKELLRVPKCAPDHNLPGQMI